MRATTAFLAIIIALALLPQIHAATLNCTIRAATSCNAGEALLIRLNSSEGTAPNNSHAQLANYSGDPYPYSLCCATDAFRTLTTACEDGGDILRLQNDTNSHVQVGLATGEAVALGDYNYLACLNVSQGTIECEFGPVCSAGYSGVVSVASSEGDPKINAHVAAYGHYEDNICCRIGGQNPPVVAWANVSPNPTATTRDDLACLNGSVTDADGDSVTLHYNWYRNGTSITVLNLPMDYDTGMTHDISGYNNHGTVNGATLLPTGGKVGGAFSFDGVDDAITFQNTSSLNPGTGDFAISAWVKTTNDAIIIDKLNDSSDGKGYRLEIVAGSVAMFTIGNGSATTTVVNSPGFNFDSFKFVVATKNATHITVSINGAQPDDGPTPILTGSLSGNTTPTIGALATGAYKGGTIDELIIFNRSLTPEEITALYNSYNQQLNGTELRRNDFWNCSITPIDSTGLNGTTVFSNRTNISGSAPLAPSLLYPANGNTSVFERYVNFQWTAADERDNDQLNYTLNYSVQPGVCSTEGSVSNIQTTNRTTGELCTDQYYNWTVTACDIDGCATSSKWNFTIASVLSIRLLNNNTDFGTLNALQTIDTEAGSVAPFLIENDGNIVVNISVNASNSPFTNAPLGSTAFQYKARANESEAYNTSASQQTYTPVAATLKDLIAKLNYSDSNDAAYVDINITVPDAEPPGGKTTNVTFRAEAAP